jgi:hypothetical protein
VGRFVRKTRGRKTPEERTYSFGVQDLLYEGYAVSGSLATPCASSSEDIAVFE